jgi:hypothetical protein
VNHACYARKDGRAPSDRHRHLHCKSTETAIAWFQKQPVIPPARWARVAFDGTIEGAVMSRRSRTSGQYEVRFDTGVGGCAYVATPAKVPADVGGLSEEPPADDAVLVVTTTETGAIDMRFSLVAACYPLDATERRRPRHQHHDGADAARSLSDATDACV